MKKEVRNLFDYYNHILTRYEIEIKLNTIFSEKILDEYKPDALVLATGICPHLPDINGLNCVRYHLYSDVLEGDIPQGQNIVVIGGDMIGLEVADS